MTHKVSSIFRDSEMTSPGQVGKASRRQHTGGYPSHRPGHPPMGTRTCPFRAAGFCSSVCQVLESGGFLLHCRMEGLDCNCKACLSPRDNPRFLIPRYFVWSLPDICLFSLINPCPPPAFHLILPGPLLFPGRKKIGFLGGKVCSPQVRPGSQSQGWLELGALVDYTPCPPGNQSFSSLERGGGLGG